MASRKESQQGKGQAQGGRPPQQAAAKQGGRPPAGGRPAAAPRERGRPPEEELPPPPTGPRATPRLRTKYDDEVRPALIRELSYSNVMQAPRVDKVIINVGLGEAKTNSNAPDAATGDLRTIAGQKPVLTKAKKSIAAFKVRQGDTVGAMVTLRGARMYDFLDKLFNVALPRVRDFSGVSPDAFDGRGNYNLGLREQIIFPEIEYDKVDRVRGMEIAIVTTARTDEEGRRLLALLGMPFQRPDQPRRPDLEASLRRRRPRATGA
jgi:large subunit ribosomal protein L5